jgi:hypothetical protein
VILSACAPVHLADRGREARGGAGQVFDRPPARYGILGAVLARDRFWQSVRGAPLNDRQRLVLNRLLDGFEGKLTTSYALAEAHEPDERPAHGTKP